MDDELQIEPKTEAPKQMPGPVMDIMPPSQASDNRLHNLPKDQTNAPLAGKQDVATPNTPKQALPKQSGNGVGLAITATVIIILGLAALATYAYLKTIR